MSDLDSRIATVREKRKSAINSQIDLSTSRFNLKINPPLTLSKVVEIENKYQIEFPAEYRAFITTVANGGFGPYHGLLSLQDSLRKINNIEYCDRSEDWLNDNFLKIPFLHTVAYCPNEDPRIMELWDKYDRGEITESECMAVDNYLTAGTMTIAWEGCGYCYFLVITGAARGQVWINGEVASVGYKAINDNFLDWYEEWLDRCFRFK